MTPAPRTRSLTISEALVRAYSRRGNYHSEAADAEALGLPGLVVQGVQVAGPAYGLLLDAWGEDFLAHGEIDLKFVGMVTAGQTVDAVVTPGNDQDDQNHQDDQDDQHDQDDQVATIEVTNRDAAAVAVVGTARRHAV